MLITLGEEVPVTNFCGQTGKWGGGPPLACGMFSFLFFLPQETQLELDQICLSWAKSK